MKDMTNYDLKSNMFNTTNDYIDFLNYIAFIINQDNKKILTLEYEYILGKLEYCGIIRGRTKKIKKHQDINDRINADMAWTFDIVKRISSKLFFTKSYEDNVDFDNYAKEIEDLTNFFEVFC